MSSDAGTKFGRYEIRSKLGAGGMGEVYQARDMELGPDVAVNSSLQPLEHQRGGVPGDAAAIHRQNRQEVAGRWKLFERTPPKADGG